MMLLLGLILLSGSFLPALHLLPWASFHNEALAAAGAGLVCAEAVRGATPVRWPIPALAVFALSLVPLAQWAFGLTLFRGDAMLSAYYLVLLGLGIAAGSRLVVLRRDDLLDGLAVALLFAALASSLVGAAQWLKVDLPLPENLFYGAMDGGRVIGNIAQPNQLACLAVLGMCSLAWLFQRGRVRSPALVGALIVLGFILVATRSRAGLLMALTLLVWSWFAHRRGVLRLSPVVGLVIAAYVSLLSAAWVPLSDALGVGAVRDGAASMSVGTRPLHWEYMLAALRESPWFGYGWAQVIVGASRVATSMPTPVFEMTEYSHSLPLDLMMWNGVPLGLAICILLVWWLWRHASGLRDEASVFALGCVLVFGVYSLVEFPYAYTFFLLPLGLMMGTVSGLAPGARTMSVPRWGQGALVFGHAVVGLVIAFDYYRMDADFREMRLSFFGLEERKAPEDAPRVIVLDHMRAFLVLGRTDVHVPQSATQIASFRKLIDRFPHPPMLVRYAVIAAKHGRPDEAREAMDRLCTLHTTRMCAMGHQDWRTWAQGHPTLEKISFE